MSSEFKKGEHGSNIFFKCIEKIKSIELASKTTVVTTKGPKCLHIQIKNLVKLYSQMIKLQVSYAKNTLGLIDKKVETCRNVRSQRGRNFDFKLHEKILK